MLEDEKTKEGVIIEAEGRPKEPNRSGEKTKLGWFKNWICKLLGKTDDLVDVYTTSEKAVKESEADRNVRQAAKLAAEAEEKKAETDLKKQQATQKFFDNVDNIFKDDELPPAAKMLKLTKLAESNPDLEKQVDKVNAIIEKLQNKRGFGFQIIDESKTLSEDREKLDKSEGETQ